MMIRPVCRVQGVLHTTRTLQVSEHAGDGDIYLAMGMRCLYHGTTGGMRCAWCKGVAQCSHDWALKETITSLDSVSASSVVLIGPESCRWYVALGPLFNSTASPIHHRLAFLQHFPRPSHSGGYIYAPNAPSSAIVSNSILCVKH